MMCEGIEFEIWRPVKLDEVVAEFLKAEEFRVKKHPLYEASLLHSPDFSNSGDRTICRRIG